MTIEARRMSRGVGAILLALALPLIAAAPSAMADTIYPDNVITGSSFDTGLSNPPPTGSGSSYAEVSNTCTLIDVNLSNPVCQTRTEHAPAIGTPAGSLEQNVTKTADALGLIDATAVAQSSPFTIAQGPTPGPSYNATFQFDICAVFEGLLDIGAENTFQFNLIDVASSTRRELWQERRPNLGDSLPNDCSAGFSGRLNDGNGGRAPISVVVGRQYRIELISHFKSGVLAAAQFNIRTYFDNIRLRVADGTPTFSGTPTAITDPATDITATGATLNGRTNANGLPTTYRFRYGVDDADDALDQATPSFSAGTGTTLQERSRSITALTACTTYLFRIEATTGANTAVGNTLSFRTDCVPMAVTDPAFPAPTVAELRSTINPNGAATTYFYEWGPDSLPAGQFPNRIPAAPNEVAIGDGNTPVSPNSQVITGLTPLTTYRARVVATNSVGPPVVANTVTFTTPGLGLTGAQGAQGDQGAAGQDGAAGAPGAQGVPGPAGANGPVGARGPAGATPTLGSSIQDLLSTNRLAMIRIDATRIRVPMSGRDIGRVRVQIFCRPIAVRTCSGNMKVRSINKINPASTGTRPARRVTFATDAVQLDVRKIGFAILNFNAQRRAVIRRQKSIRATVIVSVIDANNNRQNVRRNVTIVPGR